MSVTYPSDDLLGDLNPPQREAVLHGDGPLLIVAGAGSGKTAALTRRIAHLIREREVSPYSILAITFTNKAADELKGRVEVLAGQVARNMSMGTFHSVCGRLLRREAPRVGYRSSFSIYDARDSERLITYVMKDLDLDPKAMKPSQVAHAIGRAKDSLLTPEELEQVADNWYERKVAQVYSEYQKRLVAASAMDFDDLINVTVRVFREFPDALGRYRERWIHILVDEFQDTNHAQFEFVRLLGAPDGNVSVVGDMDQSVYAFRGADYRNLARFEEAFPSARVITLEQNYRSTQNILSAANALIENNLARKPKNLWTETGRGDLITHHEAANEHDEAAFVAAEIERLRGSEGFRYRDAAVFYRINAQSRVLEEVFTRFGIPYRVVGGLRFYERKEIKDLIAYLRVLVNPNDAVSLRRVINTPRRGLGEKTVAELVAHAEAAGMTLLEAVEAAEHIPTITSRAVGGLREFEAIIRELKGVLARGEGLGALVETTWQRTGYMAELEADRSIEALGRIENLKELAVVASEFEEQLPGATLDDFLARISLVSEQDEYDPEESVVSLMTAHNAKGLEFDLVFMAGMEEGVFPHMRSLGKPEELEEERRLAYVGITRARKRLFMTRASRRALWGGTGYNAPSRFLAEIPTDLVNSSGDGAIGTHYPDPARVGARWRVGQEVAHRRWGRGVITSLSGAGEKAEATIWFSDEGEKRVLIAYAPLEKVD